MKKIILTTLAICIFTFFAALQKLGALSNQPASVTSPSSNTSLPSSVPPSSLPSSVPQSLNSKQQVQTGYKNGQYTGQVTDAYYGNVQVKAVILGGKITDVQFLQYPSDRNTSIEINSQAMPLLTQEAIAVQNSNVDIITGATATSEAFKQSLQSALAQAL